MREGDSSMNKIVFFNMPAHGHTNPTLEVVRELVHKGNDVLYYSFAEFKDKIEETGATCICCDDYLPKLNKEDEDKVGKDFALLIDMIVDTTLALDQNVCEELSSFQPDCIVSDSLSLWGKLFAKKLNIPYICSTTTFAFNKHTSRLMKPGLKETANMILKMGKINKKIQQLRNAGYDIKSFIDIVENNNETNTIVYTSKEFQPLVETFSDKYFFVGPSVSNTVYAVGSKKKNQIYISLGTVNNKNNEFYKNCIQAFKDLDVQIVMSVGNNTDIKTLGSIPSNFVIKNSVNQIEVLQNSDVFITHCGMNSVNESLYYGVPMVLFPQHSEQKMVAHRVFELEAGLKLKKNNVANLKKTTLDVMNNHKYKENAIQLSKSFHHSGGAKQASDVILKIIESSKNPL